MEHLAGVLPHRGSNTVSEQRAAEYLQGRFREYTDDVVMEEFHSIETPFIGLSAWYGEFLFVAIIAHWLPSIAFAYGITVFVLYLVELSGYQTVTRLLPHYESQNVVASFLAPRPEGVVVVSAHYDTGRENNLQEPAMERWVHWVHRAIVAAMFIILLSCLAQALELTREWAFPVEYIFRWAAGAYLLCTALSLAYIELTADYARGSNDNASGVAALLDMARRIQADQPEELDIYLVATGSKEGGLNGMRQFIRGQKLDRDTTWFINLDRVGLGTLRYVTGEGLLYCYKSNRGLIATAESIAPRYEARPHRHRGWPTDLLIPLTRGFKAIGLTAIPEKDATPAEDDSFPDRPAQVDAKTVAGAADFTENLIRALSGN